MNILTVSNDAGQVPFEIVHTNVFKPVDIPATAVEGEPGVDTIPLPVITDQLPEPMIGVLPFKVEDDVQIVESNPALEIVGNASTI